MIMLTIIILVLQVLSVCRFCGIYGIMWCVYIVACFVNEQKMVLLLFKLNH